MVLERTFVVSGQTTLLLCTFYDSRPGMSCCFVTITDHVLYVAVSLDVQLTEIEVPTDLNMNVGMKTHAQIGE